MRDYVACRIGDIQILHTGFGTAYLLQTVGKRSQIVFQQQLRIEIHGFLRNHRTAQRHHILQHLFDIHTAPIEIKYADDERNHSNEDGDFEMQFH